ncbi:hypothetical protein [Tardibacter chloracetimidivorans]|uniref:hypothetical protein n=1 Tax=Tardibacter chloracetimidivorans TaxID=1921510 RepID=UPI001301773A|nr:hypothetical protein [Tardibacter chloracetimidivorans]
MAEALGSYDDAIFEYEPHKRVEEIETEARDGFIPWTSGGYEVCLPASLSHAWGSGSAPEPIQKIIDNETDLIADTWKQQYPDRPPFLECVLGEHGQELEEQAQEYEMESWQGDDSCYFWKARVMFLAPGDPQNETGKLEVYLDAYLNTDLNYGRDHISWLRCHGSNPNQTVGTFKRTIDADVFASMTEEQLDALVTEAIKSLP